MTPGIHLFHKPAGPTSFSVVQQCIASLGDQRGKVRTRLCHGGTLDPFAHGLLLILAGQATKLFDHLHAIPKTYEATIRWGVETDNGDPLGRATFEGDASTITPTQLDDALTHFTGWRDQVPPPTSAKRIGGERAYQKAHRGEVVELPPSRVYLHQAHWLGHDLPRESRLRLVVAGGYYVRSLARDLGRFVGAGAHLTALHRTAIGPWQDPGLDRTVEAHARDLLPWAPSRLLTDAEVGELRRDSAIPLRELTAPTWRVPDGFPDPAAPVRGFHLGKLVFLLRIDGGRLRVLSALPGGL
jgi:tRNA pseudouridine55 synthase